MAEDNIWVNIVMDQKMKDMLTSLCGEDMRSQSAEIRWMIRQEWERRHKDAQPGSLMDVLDVTPENPNVAETD